MGNFKDESSYVPLICPVRHFLLVLLNLSPFNSIFFTSFLSSQGPFKTRKEKVATPGGEQPHGPVSCLVPSKFGACSATGEILE